jgi:hypothetical protein
MGYERLWVIRMWFGWNFRFGGPPKVWVISDYGLSEVWVMGVSTVVNVESMTAWLRWAISYSEYVQVVICCDATYKPQEEPLGKIQNTSQVVLLGSYFLDHHNRVENRSASDIDSGVFVKFKPEMILLLRRMIVRSDNGERSLVRPDHQDGECQKVNDFAPKRQCPCSVRVS